MAWWQNLTVYSIGRLHRWHLKQRKMLVKALTETRRELATTLESLEATSHQLETLRDLCGEELLDEINQFLYGPETAEPFPQMDQDQAYETLHRMLDQIARSDPKTRRLVTEEAAGVLGVLCADGLLCPLATAISVYRVAILDGRFSADEATDASVLGIRQAMADRAQDV